MLSFAEPKEIVLRDYQDAAIEALRQKIRERLRRLILCAGTGAGKTLTAAALLKEASKKGSYVLFIVDRINLVDQTGRALPAFDTAPRDEPPHNQERDHDLLAGSAVARQDGRGSPGHDPRP